METVRYGSSGNSVLLLQLALKREGSYTGDLDGVFGTRTLNAVRRFQSARGFVPDGVAGPKTWSAAETYLKGAIKQRLRSGDTFYRLAKRYGTSVEAIVAANPGLDPADLPIGGDVVIPLGFKIVPTDIPYSSQLVDFTVTGMVERFPFINSEIMGYSVDGKPLYALKMGKGRRKVFINAAHHANEWITTPLVLDFLESCANAYVNLSTIEGRSAAALFSDVTLYVAPMVNPDGVDIVNGAASRRAFARALAIAEDFPDIPFPSGWKANIEGVDLNLNYPADWETARKIKFAQGYSKPAPRDYVGTEPLSAREANAVHAFTRKYDFDLTVSYHTQGGEIYWKFQNIEPEGARKIGEAMAQVSGYELAEVPYESSFAGYKDWFILDYERPGYTVEAGRGRNPLPLFQYDEIRRDNFPLMVEAMEG
ncbi:MAG: peptidoglycan-binding protein [Clostridia bacterium]|nr:peptidoglycan-binding protein [Clostridia bacterium]MBR3459945.1 peptidoglycan-binding protein [Clostridia bacterium]